MPFIACGPNEVLVVSGCCLGQPLMISKGGSKFVLPGLQKYQKLSLNVKTILIVSPRIYTKLGVPITVTGVAQVKIESNHKEMLDAACEQFMSYKPAQVIDTIKETLEAHQRAIMGIMTVEEIYMDRQKFSEEVFRVASADLMHMGVSVVSYTIKDVTDEEGYLKALGQTRTSQVIRDARVGEAEAKRDAEIRKANAQKAQMKSKLENDTLIAQAQRDFLVQKAGFEKEVHAKEAIAQRAYQLQEAITRQQIMLETRQVDVVERQCQIELQQLETEAAERRLTATVRKTALAEQFRLETQAAASKTRLVRQAEADAEKRKLLGEAEAFAIQIVGSADAEQMTLKADAWAQYQKAAKVDMVLKMLPKMAAEVAQPLAQCKSVTMVANGDDSEIGVGKMTGEILGVMSKLTDTVNEMSRGSVGVRDII